MSNFAGDCFRRLLLSKPRRRAGIFDFCAYVQVPHPLSEYILSQTAAIVHQNAFTAEFLPRFFAFSIDKAAV